MLTPCSHHIESIFIMANFLFIYNWKISIIKKWSVWIKTRPGQNLFGYPVRWIMATSEFYNHVTVYLSYRHHLHHIHVFSPKSTKNSHYHYSLIHKHCISWIYWAPYTIIFTWLNWTECNELLLSVSCGVNKWYIHII